MMEADDAVFKRASRSATGLKPGSRPDLGRDGRDAEPGWRGWGMRKRKSTELEWSVY